MIRLFSISLISIFLSISISGQASNALLYGKIDNSRHDTIYLYNHYGQTITKTTHDGQFKLPLNIEHSDFFTFQIKGDHFTLILLEGDTLEMNFDFFDIKNSISFKGDKAETNKNLVFLSKGALAPDFTFQNQAGDSLSLRDFKGKYVYIDVWNSKCSPCFKEFPKMEELAEKFAARNIEFLGISFDKNETIWRKTMAKKDLTGIQLYANGWDPEFVKNYHIWFNPRFILVDKDQNILYLSALRPSGNIEIILSSLPDL